MLNHTKNIEGESDSKKDDKNKTTYKKGIDKIYSRWRIQLPDLKRTLAGKNLNHDFNKIKNQNYQKNLRKVIKIAIILMIAFLVTDVVLKAIEPIIDAQCVTIAKGIATKISNEQATAVMANYSYEDLMKITKDEEGNIKLISANIITINQIISDIPILIQNELEKVENSRFYIKLGSFTGSKILSGRGPDVEIKISAIGNIETDLKSEFVEAGINQTSHRIFLEVRCHVKILTPFDSIDEEIVNQVLLAEGVIIGDIPSTYYNLKGLKQDNLIDIVE